ncbi:MAG: TonB-dependent receptor plug domain-containing protein, partial [Myxococcota bacterium]
MACRISALLFLFTYTAPVYAAGDADRVAELPTLDPKAVEAIAKDTPGASHSGDDVEVISILGSPLKRERIAGSAHRVEDDALERWEYDDAGRLLKQVPGVYVRDEDGYGLRPNIGLRGANSDRSRKVVLMEDGVLFAPAPYSASAAYYFPIVTRVTGLEVFKGPAAIRYGPNTIGGAV